MRRDLLAVLFSALALGLPASLRAQQITKEQFRTDFSKALQLADQKLMDQTMKKDRAAPHAALYFEELYIEKLKGHDDVTPLCDALKASWARCFEKSGTLDKLQRWVDGMEPATYDLLQKGRTSSYKLWQFNSSLQSPTREERLKVMHDYMTLATNAQQIGHSLEVAELWGLAGVIGNQVPDKTLDDRREALRCTDEFLRARRDWEFTFDTIYIQSFEFAKAEKGRIEDAQKKTEKRLDAGYDPNAKGIDSLVMAGAKPDLHGIQYEPLAAWDGDLDYGPKNGPVPALWWSLSIGKVGESRKFEWFRRREMYLARTGAAKFGISLEAGDTKKLVEVEVSSKAKPATFWLDADKKVPYAMFFWAGSDREHVGEAETNLMFSDTLANVYYRSAASWKTAIGADALVFYDDNCNGLPCDTDVFEPPYKVATIGDHAGDGTSVPLLDSMRLGKGPRQPYSEFVKLSTGWFHMRLDKENVGLRPLNPEYFKTGKIKLVWNGPKPSAPAQLVVQGAGDFKTAFFDVAGGKEVEVPVGNYTVILGRIVVGKGARAQLATIYQGTSAAFAVEAGKVTELKMGAPFTLQFERGGDENATVDALKVLLREATGCVLTELHGMALAPEVLAAKAEDGKGAKVVGKFVRFTDSELLNKATAKHNKLGLLCATFPMPEGYREGEMVLKVKMPGPGWKMRLSMKKHPLFPLLESPWQ